MRISDWSSDVCSSDLIFYPRAICPHSGSTNLEWRDASGRGTVYSTTVVRRKPDRGGNYNVALLDLEAGPRMMSRVDGVRSEEHTSELQSLMRISYAVLCLKTTNIEPQLHHTNILH